MDLKKLAALQGDRSNHQFAREIGVDAALITRIKRLDTMPGEKFIARMLAHFPDLNFDDLFSLEESFKTGTDGK